MRIKELEKVTSASNLDVIAIDTENGTKQIELGAIGGALRLGEIIRINVQKVSVETASANSNVAISEDCTSFDGFFPVGIVGYALGNANFNILKMTCEYGKINVAFKNTSNTTFADNELNFIVLYVKSSLVSLS